MADELNNGLQVQSTQGHEDEAINVVGLKAALQKFKTDKVDPLQWPMVAVAELPTATASTMHKIYLVPSTNPKQKNAKDEFITIATTETVEEQEVTTYSWEQIGSTTVDLSNYATLQALSDAIAAVRAEDVAVTTLNAAPTSSTTSYTKGGQSVDFKIGDEVRVADAEQATEGANGYVYYKLYDLVDNQGTKTAYWDLIGAGGGDVTGRIKVSVATYINDIAASASMLGNVAVTLTNTTDSTTVETKTWNGSDITFTKLTPLKDYRVTVEDKTGWLRNKSYEDITNLGIGEEKTASFTYSADEYTCSVSGTADGRIVVSGTEYANNATFRVAKGTSITATAKVVANYVTPTPSISGKTISATYVAYGYVTVNTSSNQGTDSTIAAVSPSIKIGDAAAVTYSAPVQVAPDTQVVVTWPDVTGYKTPTQQTFTKSGTTDETKSGEYQTEILTISIAKDGGDGNLSTVSINVTHGQASLGTLTQASPTMKIPYGVNYKLTPSALDGYSTPAAVTKDWADTTAKSLVFTYEEVTMLTGYIILDQTSADPTTKVIDESGHTYASYQRPAVIDAIRAASHCYVGTFANNKMTLKQLDDTDGTKYADGTSAATDIASTGKDVFMRLPFFFTRVSQYATDKIKIEFAFDPNQTVTTTAQPDGSGWKQWGGNDLIGKYEAYETNNMTYSKSGVDSTGNVSQANMKSHARARGTGFTLVKWRHQNLMAILFYAYYGHTNCQTLIGSGARAYNGSSRYTGLKNSLGMTDTTSANGNTGNIVFWGLENWWGCKYEWVDNVVINNHTWTITEDDNTTRTIQSSAMASGNDAWIYPSKFIIGDDLDVIAAAGQSGGSDSQGYCDAQYYTSSSSRVVRRSNSRASAYGGVACVVAGNDSSNTDAGSGSRLAFKGTIEIA